MVWRGLFPAEGTLAKSVSTLWGRAFKVAQLRQGPSPPGPPLNKGGKVMVWRGLFPAEGALAKSVSTLWGRAFKVASSALSPLAPP